ncbi:MAG: DUF1444 family protein [Xanthomonadaceae bacterium]|nr:DUF1444 family protein [Xanthomonadaceae bacterium]
MAGFLSGLRGLFGAKEELPTPQAFTELAQRMLSAEVPSARVQIVGDLELTVDADTQGEHRIFLDNAYRAYAAESPKDRMAALERFVRSYAEAARGLDRSPDRIVPIVKTRAWLSDVQASMRRMNEEKAQSNVYEDLTDELIVVYAIDTPSNIAYLAQDELDAIGIPRADLRAHAVRNLRGLLPGIDVKRGPQIGMVVADGNYEPSLILFADLWARESAQMRGAPAVACPGHDILLFADSANESAVTQLRALASKLFQDAQRPLTPRVHLLRDGVPTPID